MKKFSYNNVQYTIHGANELKNFPHPCIADDNGSCPYGSQKTILRELLKANGVYPEESENLYQYITRALKLPDSASADIHGHALKLQAEIFNENLCHFKKLLEWFVRQLKINGNILSGKHISGLGYKGHNIRNYYAEWRDYGDFTLDITLQCGTGIGKSVNYIHVTDSWINIIAEYEHPEPKKM